MSNPVEKLYGSYNPFDHAKAQVLDPELNMYSPMDYVVPAGPSNRVYDTVQSSTQTSTQTQNFIRQMTLEDMTSSYVIFHQKVALRFPLDKWGDVLKANVDPLIKAGNIFMNQFPLQQAATNIQCIVAGTTISLDSSTLASYLLKGYKHMGVNPYLDQFPSAPDTSATFVPGPVPNLSDPFIPPNLLPPKTSTRNLQAFNWSFIEADIPANCAGIYVEWEEPSLLDLFSLSREAKRALSGINQIQFINSFGAPAIRIADILLPSQPLERIFNITMGNEALITTIGLPKTMQQVISQSAITFAEIPEMHFIQYSQNLSFPLFNMYSRAFEDYSSGYQNQTIGDKLIPQKTANARPVQAQFGAISMNSTTILEIPKMFMIWIGQQGSYKRAWDSSWAAVPQKISIRFAGQQNLLASATPRELYNLSVKNGLNMTWYEAQQCGFPLILLPSDLGMSAGALILEGVTGSYQFQIQSLDALTPLGFDTTDGPITLTNLQIHMLPVYSLEFQINNNRANIVSVAGMSANEAVNIPFIDTSNAEHQSVITGGSKFTDLVKRVVHGYHNIIGPIKSGVTLAKDLIQGAKKMSGAGTTRLTYR